MFFYRFSEIVDIAHTARNVRKTAQYVGKDANGKAIYDNTIKLPIIEYTGTVKMHGTNAGICFNLHTGEVGFISRERVLSVEEDNAGFAAFGYRNPKVTSAIFDKIKEHIASNPKLPQDSDFAIVYGEWVGPKVSRGSALVHLEPTFVAIRTRLFTEDLSVRYWLDDDSMQAIFGHIDLAFDQIDYSQRFERFTIAIDFNKPEFSYNLLAEKTISVEEQCPVALALGIDPQVCSTGEGIVWVPKDKKWLQVSDAWFKTKGEKHSKTRVKKVITVDMDKLEKFELLCEEVCPPWRIEQMATAVFDLNNDGLVEKSGTTKLVRAVMDDIKKEQLEVIEAAGAELKDIGRAVYKRCLAYISNATSLK